MEACWPSGVGLSGAGVKPPCAALAKDRRGERQGEGAAGLAEAHAADEQVAVDAARDWLARNDR